MYKPGSAKTSSCGTSISRRLLLQASGICTNHVHKNRVIENYRYLKTTTSHPFALDTYRVLRCQRAPVSERPITPFINLGRSNFAKGHRENPEPVSTSLGIGPWKVAGVFGPSTKSHGAQRTLSKNLNHFYKRQSVPKLSDTTTLAGKCDVSWPCAQDPGTRNVATMLVTPPLPIHPHRLSPRGRVAFLYSPRGALANGGVRCPR